MRPAFRYRAAVAAATMCLLAAAPASAASSSLAVRDGDSWRTFWRSDEAPARFAAANPALMRAIQWKRLAPGLEWSEVRLGCAGPVWRARLIVARLDPREVRLTLAMELTRDDMRPAWTIDRAPEDAILAVNAAQFTSAMPWGWVVIDGRQRLAPGAGPLASAVGIDRDGGIHWAHGDTLAATDIVTGFQSYPTLLSHDGTVPAPLRTVGSLVSLTHRDTRLAFGEARDGRILIAMTRYDAVGTMGEGIPLGPTTPEMAAIMGSLGAHDAVMLDGGISAQLLLRGADAREPLRWHAIRKVPLALIARPRDLGRAAK
ncbi:MAG TPA: phosphodiester glycosidase family protein [Tepidiformaceae bacterium]|nr:phosphodiester glycosidase family protein [Tepidiformaceae bacterium]